MRHTNCVHQPIDRANDRMKNPNDLLVKTRLMNVMPEARKQISERLFGPGHDVKIFAKFEFESPTGSLKDRAAAFMVCKYASMRPNQILNFFDYSPGECNWGIALARACQELGHKAHVLVGDDIPPNCEALLKKYGADIIKIPGVSSWKDMMREAGRIASSPAFRTEDSRWVWTNQYENPFNELAHYEITGKEIAEQLREYGEKPVFFVATVGTGGSAIGITRRLAKEFGRCALACVQPTSDTPKIKGARKLEWPSQGKPGNVPGVFARGKRLVDRYIFIDPEEAMRHAKGLNECNNMDISVSSAMNHLAALELSNNMPGGAIVTLFPAVSRRRSG